PSPHLTEEAWDGLADGTLSASARDAAQEHVTRCEACAMVYRGIILFERESRALGAPGRSVSPFRAALRYWPASIAAMLALGVTVSLLYRSSHPAITKAPPPSPVTTEARAE